MQKRRKVILFATAVIAVILLFLVVNKNVFIYKNENVTADTEVDKSIYMDASKSVEERVEALLVQMTLEEKVAQMVQAEQNGISLREITQYGVDAVHGHSNIYGATVYPHNIGLGDADDDKLMKRMGAVVAEEVRATGIQWTFAPSLANPQNELWGRTYEGFGEDAELVARLGAAFITGVQGELGKNDFLSESRVLATAKHYIGEGYTKAGMVSGQMRNGMCGCLKREIMSSSL